MAQPDDSYDLTLAAASLRSSSSDLPLLLKALSDELSDTLGTRLRIQRVRGRRKSQPIASVHIAMDHSEFDAAVDGASLHCSIGHTSGGIRIRSESVGMDEWILRLLEALQAEAAHSESARRALEHIVIGGHE